jgi:hypothetical protein
MGEFMLFLSSSWPGREVGFFTIVVIAIFFYLAFGFEEDDGPGNDGFPDV